MTFLTKKSIPEALDGVIKHLDATGTDGIKSSVDLLTYIRDQIQSMSVGQLVRDITVNGHNENLNEFTRGVDRLEILFDEYVNEKPSEENKEVIKKYFESFREDFGQTEIKSYERKKADLFIIIGYLRFYGREMSISAISTDLKIPESIINKHLPDLVGKKVVNISHNGTGFTLQYKHREVK